MRMILLTWRCAHIARTAYIVKVKLASPMRKMFLSLFTTKRIIRKIRFIYKIDPFL